MRRGELNPMHGRKHTAEAKAKMANATRELNARRQYTLAPQRVVIPAGVQLGYFAGLVDGEGSLRFHGDRRPFVAVYGELAIAEWLVSNVGGSFGNPDLRGRVPNYRWIVQGARDVYAVAVAVRPLLIVKAEDASAVINALEEKYGSRIAD